MNLDLLAAYLLRTAPAVLIGAAFLLVLPRRFLEVRLLSYILLFILMRDAMTPLGLWRVGSEGAFWLRVVPDAGLLLFIGLASAGIVVLTNRLEPDLARLLVWGKGHPLTAFAAGIAGALVIAAPVALMYTSIPLAERGGPIPTALLPALLAFCLLANLYEESLFRGYFQGYVEQFTAPWRAALLAGILFGFGHAFLAVTVTNAGPTIIVFTLYEGLIAAFIRLRFGLLASTVAHGGGIFLLASGLF